VRGYDAAKKITGRKRHILTDTDGRLLAVRVHPANVQDRDGARLALKASRATFPFVETVFADGGYGGRLEAWARAKANVALSIVRRPRTIVIRAPAAALGYRTFLRLVDQEPSPRTRLRAARRNL
jgi:hypothetical protein